MRRELRRKIALVTALGMVVNFLLPVKISAFGKSELPNVSKEQQIDYPVDDVRSRLIVKMPVETSEKSESIIRNKTRNSSATVQNYPELFEKAGGFYGRGKLSAGLQNDYDLIYADLKSVVTKNLDIAGTELEDNEVIYERDIELNYVSTEEELIQLWYTFLQDHPEFYWLDGGIGYSIRTKTISGVFKTKKYIICPLIDENYNTDKERDAMDAVIDSGVASYISAVEDEKDIYERVRIIHDKIIDTIDYSYESAGVPDSSTDAHSIVGVFSAKKRAVCEGYAKAFSFLLNYFDIPQVYIVGDVVTSSGTGGHAWNIVSFDGGATYYDMDLTWDDLGNTSTPSVRYDYFAMDDTLFSTDHHPDTSDGEWYSENGYSWQYDLPVLGKDYKFSYYYHYDSDLYNYSEEQWVEQTEKACEKSPNALVHILIAESKLVNYMSVIKYQDSEFTYSLVSEYSGYLQNDRMAKVYIPRSMYYEEPEETEKPEAAPTEDSGEGKVEETEKPEAAPTEDSGEGKVEETEKPEAAPTEDSGEGKVEETEKPEVAPTEQAKGTESPDTGVTKEISSSDLPEYDDSSEDLGKTSGEKSSTLLTVGDKYRDTSSKSLYQVISSGSMAYVSPLNKKVTSVVIPARVVVDGTSYKVTAIRNSAFKNMKKLKSVVIGKNVKTIGAKAFYNCKKLAKVTIKTKLLKKNSIGKKAFVKTYKKCVYRCPRAKRKNYKKYLRTAGAKGTFKS